MVNLSINYISHKCAFNEYFFSSSYLSLKDPIFLQLFPLPQSILEPGYYQDGEFGIRLETIVMTTKVDLPVSKPAKVVHIMNFTLFSKLGFVHTELLSNNDTRILH